MLQTAQYNYVCMYCCLQTTPTLSRPHPHCPDHTHTVQTTPTLSRPYPHSPDHPYPLKANECISDHTPSALDHTHIPERACLHYTRPHPCHVILTWYSSSKGVCLIPAFFFMDWKWLKRSRASTSVSPALMCSSSVSWIKTYCLCKNRNRTDMWNRNEDLK